MEWAMMEIWVTLMARKAHLATEMVMMAMER